MDNSKWDHETKYTAVCIYQLHRRTIALPRLWHHI